MKTFLHALLLVLLLAFEVNAQLIRREFLDPLLGAPITYANLPGAPRTGDTYWVSDANATCSAGGSTNNMIVGWTGAAWACLGSAPTPLATGSQWYCSDAGSTDAYACNTTVPFTSYVTGSFIDLRPNTNNTGTATVNVWSLGAKDILRYNGATLDNNDLQAGLIYRLVYDGTAFRVTAESVTALSKRRVITFRIGSDQGQVLTDTDDEANMWTNDLAAMHITQVRCSSDAGSPIINLQRDDGSAANILSTNLTCATGVAGATSTGFTSGEDAIAAGHAINFVMVTAGGVAKRVTVTITATLD